MPGPCTLCREKIEPYQGHLKELCPGCNKKFETLRSSAPKGQSGFSGSATRVNAFALPLAKTILEKLDKNKTTPMWLKGSMEVLVSTLNGDLLE